MTAATTSIIPVCTLPQLALLIDAENIAGDYAPQIVERTLARYGNPIIRRAYGDWTTNQLVQRKRHLEDQGLRPVQQFRHIKGKNSSDATLIMDAMELVHLHDIDGFCLVSSDCDFTALAGRLRERGKRVYGFGMQQTMRAFVTACDEFVFLDRTK